MSKTITRQIGSFKAVSESGKVITIYKKQQFEIVGEFGVEPQEIPGNISLATSDGKPVNKIDENTYETLVGAEIVRFTRK